MARGDEERGRAGLLHALIGDEPPQKALPTIRANAIWLKQQWPELKIWMAARPQKELMDVVDIWDAITAGSTSTTGPRLDAETLDMPARRPASPNSGVPLIRAVSAAPNVRLDDDWSTAGRWAS